MEQKQHSTPNVAKLEERYPRADTWITVSMMICFLGGIVFLVIGALTFSTGIGAAMLPTILGGLGTTGLILATVLLYIRSFRWSLQKAEEQDDNTESKKVSKSRRIFAGAGLIILGAIVAEVLNISHNWWLNTLNCVWPGLIVTGLALIVQAIRLKRQAQ